MNGEGSLVPLPLWPHLSHRLIPKALCDKKRVKCNELTTIPVPAEYGIHMAECLHYEASALIM